MFLLCFQLLASDFSGNRLWYIATSTPFSVVSVSAMLPLSSLNLRVRVALFVMLHSSSTWSKSSKGGFAISTVPSLSHLHHRNLIYITMWKFYYFNIICFQENTRLCHQYCFFMRERCDRKDLICHHFSFLPYSNICWKGLEPTIRVEPQEVPLS